MSEKTPGIAWSGPPDPERGVYYPIRSPKPGREVVGVVLSETITGAIVYYEPAGPDERRGRSRPCNGDKKTCEGCLGGRDHVWKGYLACWDRQSGRLFLAEVTREAYLRCPMFELFKGALRAKLLRLTRNGEHANARVGARLEDLRVAGESLPPAFNVKSALERLWFGGDGPQAVTVA